MFVPFLVHWYPGVVPPFVGVAVNVTLVPEQMVVAVALAVTLGVSVEFTVIVVPALVAVVGEAQGALLVNTTAITSAFTKVVLV
jgi:ABC-type transport system involved in cytochrome bd biosynthesis fused ATPase/permease subunit